MRTIIAGGRDITDYKLVQKAVKNSGFNITIVISGAQRGVDALGERYAEDNHLPCERYPADWKKFDKSAGPIRNRQMAENADALIAVWDGNSKGTKNMIETAEKFGLKVYVEIV